MTESQKIFLTNMEQALIEMIGDYLTDHKFDLDDAGFKDDENLHINMARSAMREIVGDHSLDKIIADMDYEIKQLKRAYSLNSALHSIQFKASALSTYLTRLKALRENSNDKKEDDESK
jgi:hypothetical protein